MILLLIAVVVHAICFIVLAWAWSKIDSTEPGGKDLEPFVSVLIPIRNEEENILSLLRQLERQEYSTARFEVVIIDDHSEDLSADVIKVFIAKTGIDVTLISLDTTTGKKSALETGVRKAKGQVILCTDGDCKVLPTWISTYARVFSDEKIKMVTGPVKMVPVNGFGQYQALDFSSLIGFGAASLQLGIPSTCNGANMAYRKEVFEELGGYEGNRQIPSGDDEFLLQKVHQRYPNGVKFLKKREAVVATAPKEDLKAFLQQRIRWSSKWRFHSSNIVKTAAIWVFLDSILFFALMYVGFWADLRLIFMLFFVRIVPEVYYLSRVSKFFNVKVSSPYYLAISIMSPFYIFFLGFASIFGKYSWKGRRYS